MPLMTVMNMETKKFRKVEGTALDALLRVAAEDQGDMDASNYLTKYEDQLKIGNRCLSIGSWTVIRDDL